MAKFTETTKKTKKGKMAKITSGVVSTADGESTELLVSVIESRPVISLWQMMQSAVLRHQRRTLDFSTESNSTFSIATITCVQPYKAKFPLRPLPL